MVTTREFARRWGYVVRGGPEAQACLGTDLRCAVIPCYGGRVKAHEDQPWRVGTPKTYAHVLGDELVVTGLCRSHSGASRVLNGLPAGLCATKWADGEWEVRVPVDRFERRIGARLGLKRRRARSGGFSPVQAR